MIVWAYVAPSRDVSRAIVTPPATVRPASAASAAVMSVWMPPALGTAETPAVGGVVS